MMKKLAALFLALVMVLSVSAVAMAVNLEENGEAGVAGNWVTADTERPQGKSVNIKKEIIAFNPNGSTVNAPVVTYTYTVTPASVSNLTVTDATADHESGTAVTAPVKAGPTTGLVVTGTAAGNQGDSTSAVGTLVFTNANTWETAEEGRTTTYDINLDFTGVTFTQPGVYRYQIAETISAASYDAVAMKDGGTNTLYLDVYVDGDLAIYGYVCMSANASVDPSTATKINGFVNSGNVDGSDKYYTYDLTLDKDVVNDTYGEGHDFPFTVAFSNPQGYTSTFTITEDAETGSTGITPAAASIPTWSGVAKVKEGSTITYKGIPAGVNVNVYETNDMPGVTYAVSTKVNGTEKTTNASLATGSTSTAVDVETAKIAKNAAQSVLITNTLVTISPTGVVLRIAPYALILGAGIALLLISRRRKVKAEEE